MGLDAVEIVMHVEDHFGISIKNTEAAQIRTVGDLATLVHKRIEAAHNENSDQQTAFLQLRSLVHEVTDNEHLEVEPKFRIVDSLTPVERRRLWCRVEEALGVRLPSLRRPPLMRKGLVVCVLNVLVLAIATTAMVDIVILPLSLALVATISLSLHLLTIRFRVDPPERLETFAAVCKRIRGMTVATERLHLRSFDAVLDELRPILVDSLGVDESEIVATALLIEDLGMG